MSEYAIAILVYGDSLSGRNALQEEKYRELAEALLSAGYGVDSVLYHDTVAESLRASLLKYDAILVWVNPVEQGNNRTRLDALLREIAGKGCFVSAHPETILKIGTKEVLFTTRDMGWAGDVKLYTSFADFQQRFPGNLETSGTRILKQYRGNGGNGVFKVSLKEKNKYQLTHAAAGQMPQLISGAELNQFFHRFFLQDGMLIDQEWNQHTLNGMVRCYVSGTKVAGFGYQEINALYELNDTSTNTYFPPSRRYYFTENCGLFSDLKLLMEQRWIPGLQEHLSIADEDLPVIWDADFFINRIDSKENKYTLCEINASSVSPFPPSAIPFIVNGVRQRLADPAKATLDTGFPE